MVWAIEAAAKCRVPFAKKGHTCAMATLIFMNSSEGIQRIPSICADSEQTTWPPVSARVIITQDADPLDQITRSRILLRVGGLLCRFRRELLGLLLQTLRKLLLL